MTTSTSTIAGPSPAAHAPKLIAMLSAAARKTGAGFMDLLRMSAGLNSVNPEQFAHRIVHDWGRHSGSKKQRVTGGAS